MPTQTTFNGYKTLKIKVLKESLVDKHRLFRFMGDISKEYARFVNQKKLVLVTASDIIEEEFAEGRPVYFNGHVYFDRDRMNHSLFNGFRHSATMQHKKINNSQSSVYMAWVKDERHVPVMMSVITLAKQGFFTEAQAKEKLKKMIKEEKKDQLDTLLEV